MNYKVEMVFLVQVVIQVVPDYENQSIVRVDDIVEKKKQEVYKVFLKKNRKKEVQDA